MNSERIRRVALVTGLQTLSSQPSSVGLTTLRLERPKGVSTVARLGQEWRPAQWAGKLGRTGSGPA